MQLKKADEYLEEIGHGLYTSYSVKDANNKFVSVISIENAKKVIKQAQEDAIRETVKECTESAYVEYKDLETGEIFDYTDVITDDGVGAYVSQNSILSVADKLIKKL